MKRGVEQAKKLSGDSFGLKTRSKTISSEMAPSVSAASRASRVSDTRMKNAQVQTDGEGFHITYLQWAPQWDSAA